MMHVTAVRRFVTQAPLKFLMGRSNLVSADLPRTGPNGGAPTIRGETPGRRSRTGSRRIQSHTGPDASRATPCQRPFPRFRRTGHGLSGSIVRAVAMGWEGFRA